MSIELESEFQFTDEVFSRIMPQKEPMLLCDGILRGDFHKNEQTSLYTVGKRPATALLPDGSLPAVCLMEVMAQTVAGVLSGRRYLFENGESLKAGLFLSVRGFKMLHHFAKGVIPKDTVLETSISFSEGVEGVVLAQAGTSMRDIRGGLPVLTEVATARIMVLSPTVVELKHALGAQTAEALLEPDD